MGDQVQAPLLLVLGQRQVQVRWQRFNNQVSALHQELRQRTTSYKCRMRVHRRANGNAALHCLLVSGELDEVRCLVLLELNHLQSRRRRGPSPGTDVQPSLGHGMGAVRSEPTLPRVLLYCTDDVRLLTSTVEPIAISCHPTRVCEGVN